MGNSGDGGSVDYGSSVGEFSIGQVKKMESIADGEFSR